MLQNFSTFCYGFRTIFWNFYQNLSKFLHDLSKISPKFLKNIPQHFYKIS